MGSITTETSTTATIDEVTTLTDSLPTIFSDRDYRVRLLHRSDTTTCFHAEIDGDTIDTFCIKHITEERIKSLRNIFIGLPSQELRESPITEEEQELVIDNLKSRLSGIDYDTLPLPRPHPEHFGREHVVFDYIPGITVKDLLNILASGFLRLNLMDRLILATGVARELSDLQDESIIHGDIAPNNIVLRGLHFDYTQDRLYIKQGKNKRYLKGHKPIPCPRSKFIDTEFIEVLDSEHKARKTETLGCNLWYAPHEYIKDGLYSPNSETQPLGIVLFELLCQRKLRLEPSAGSFLYYLTIKLEPKNKFSLRYDRKEEQETARLLSGMLPEVIRETQRPVEKRPSAIQVYNELVCLEKYITARLGPQPTLFMPH